jgi:hypothetical protein
MRLKKKRDPDLLKLAQKQILAFLLRGPLTWEEISDKAGLNDDDLGLVLCVLMYEKKVRTEARGETRIYKLCT